jgi:NADH:ubiquinone oxidoreductase subunit H
MMFFFLKILFIVVIAIVVRGMLPRYRVDQIINKN